MLNIATPLQGKKQKNKYGKIEITNGVTISDVLCQRYYDMNQKHIGEEKLQELVNCFINKVSELHFPFDIFLGKKFVCVFLSAGKKSTGQSPHIL